MLPHFLQGLALGLPAAATPGPLQGLLLSLTLRQGWRRTLPAAFAPLISDGPIIVLVLFLLVRTPPVLLDGLRIAGGIFLIFLAYQTAAHMTDGESISDGPTTASTTGLLQASLANLLNPNPYIFWSLVAGPLLLEAWRLAPAAGISFLAGFYSAIITGFALTILLSALLVRVHRQARLWLSRLAALMLLVFAGYLLWSGATALLAAS